MNVNAKEFILAQKDKKFDDLSLEFGIPLGTEVKWRGNFMRQILIRNHINCQFVRFFDHTDTSNYPCLFSFKPENIEINPSSTDMIVDHMLFWAYDSNRVRDVYFNPDQEVKNMVIKLMTHAMNHLGEKNVTVHDSLGAAIYYKKEGLVQFSHAFLKRHYKRVVSEHLLDVFGFEVL